MAYYPLNEGIGLLAFFACLRAPIFLNVCASTYRLDPGGQLGPPKFDPVQTPSVPRAAIDLSTF